MMFIIGCLPPVDGSAHGEAVAEGLRFGDAGGDFYLFLTRIFIINTIVFDLA